MDVFELRGQVIDDYASYVRSFFTIRDARVETLVENALTDGQLWPDPLLQLSPSFQPGETLDALPSKPSVVTDQLAVLRAAIATRETSRVQTDDVPFYEDLAVAAGQFDTSQLPRPSRKVSIAGSRSFERRPGVAYFVAPTRGRSMEPLIRDGDICVYERSASSATGAIVLVQRARADDGEGGRFVVKERGNGVWRSHNPEHPPICRRCRRRRCGPVGGICAAR